MLVCPNPNVGVLYKLRKQKSSFRNRNVRPNESQRIAV